MVVLQNRAVHEGLRILTEGLIAPRLHDTDDPVSLPTRQVPDRETQSRRVTAWPEALSHGFVDNHDQLRALSVLTGELTAFKEGNSHSLKIIGTYISHGNVNFVLATGWFVPWNTDGH